MFLRLGYRRFACLALLASSLTPLLAQRDAASLEGRIVDSSGAVVANAAVVAVNTATNFAYRVQSDATGAWSISPVAWLRTSRKTRRNRQTGSWLQRS